MAMTREAMIDEAVRRKMKIQAMRRVLSEADRAEEIRATRVPSSRVPRKRRTDLYAHPRWFNGSVADRALSMYPGRVRAIRAEFRRIEQEQPPTVADYGRSIPLPDELRRELLGQGA